MPSWSRPLASRSAAGRFLGHVQRVLVAHVDDARADLDPVGPDADRRQKRKRGRELPCEMMNAHERSVDADLFGRDCELDRLAERVAPGVCQPSGWVPGAERQEADLFWMSHTRHNVLDRSSIPPAGPRGWPAGVARYRSVLRHRTGIAAVPELLHEPGMRGFPAELRAGPGRGGALVEQQHLGEVVTQARTGLAV